MMAATQRHNHGWSAQTREQSREERRASVLGLEQRKAAPEGRYRLSLAS